MSDLDGHVLGPIDDQINKIQKNDPLYGNPQYSTAPEFPKLKFNFTDNLSFNPNTSNIQQYVEDALGRIKINGYSASFNGGSIDFNIPINKPIEATLISQNTHSVNATVIPVPIVPSVGFENQFENGNNIPVISASQLQNNAMLNSGGNFNYVDINPVTFPILNNTNGNVPITENTITNNQNDVNAYPSGLIVSEVNYSPSQPPYDSSKKNYDIPLAIRDGDTSYFSSTYVPIYLTRGDNQRKILCEVLVDSSFVVEGGEVGDKTGYLPDGDSYYIASDNSEKHPWKVTNGGSVEDVQQWNYAGGEIYTQGTMQTVTDGTLSDDDAIGEGFIVLAFDRDSSTREIVADSAVVTLEETVPNSNETTQYRVLAKVNSAEPVEILQLQFEELRIYEELVVENGALKLQSYEMSHRNNYNLPT